MSTVAVYDTEPIAIEGLRCLLEAHSGLRVVATGARIEEGLMSIRHLHPSLLIVDRGFGVHAVMDLLRIMRADHCATSVIVWGSSLGEAEALRYIQAGASGVVRKVAPVNDIQTCIRTVLGGGTWMEYSLMPSMDLVIRHGRTALTPREMQVMELVERGMKNKEIGESLGIQTGTVKIHLKHIFEKTGIRGRYGLALNGLKHRGIAGALAS